MTRSQYTPVALFAYNRPDHIRRAVESLLTNREARATKLYVFSDGPKNKKEVSIINEVRHYLSSIRGFAEIRIIARPVNVGLATNVILGITEIINTEGQLIVLEDDLIVSPYFLAYMNDALDMYESENAVISIHGYMYPLRESLPPSFFWGFTSSWGWATWKRGWNLFSSDGKTLLRELNTRHLTHRFDLDGAYPFTKMLEDQIAGKNSSWAIRWNAAACISGKLSLYPGESLVQNSGNDSSGTHIGTTRWFDTKLRSEPLPLQKIVVEEDFVARKALAEFYRSMPRTRFRRVAALFGGKPW